jgi:predicted transcriptional regulator
VVRTQIQLTEEQANALKKLAVSRHLSVAELIRQAVTSFIKSSTVVDAEERQKRAIAAAGRFHSGIADLSNGHDKHLAETLSK